MTATTRSFNLRPWTRISHPREIVRQFTPNWFTATMGTGILALTVAQVPFAPSAMHAIGTWLWFANIVLFAVCSALTIARAAFFWTSFKPLFTHPLQSLFLGAIPMGLATIVNGLFAFGIPLFGVRALGVAVPLWWLDVVLAVAVGWLIPYIMFTAQEQSIDKMTAVWLLPIVPAEVTAASGGLLAPHLSPEHARRIIDVSVMLWTFSVPLALGILSILFMRLALHSIPPREMAVSGWLTLGPLGTGALGAVLLGSGALHAYGATSLAWVVPIAHGVGLIGGILLWGYGTWWWVMAIVMTLHHAKELPFNLGWWGFTFPLGVYAAATFALGRETGDTAFVVLATMFVGILTTLWLLVMTRTMHGAWHGYLFNAPCLADRNGNPIGGLDPSPL